MNLLPIFLSLRQKCVLLVGAGRIAENKVAQLLEAGARLRVVAPEATLQMRAWSQEQRIEWHRRSFCADDLDGCNLAIAATNNREINAAVYHAATQRGIFANSVDDPENCDFFFSSNLRRGPLQIAISTRGESPALGQGIRDLLEAQLPLDLGDRLRALGAQRRNILSQQPGGPARTAWLKSLAKPLLHDVRIDLSALKSHAPEKKGSGTVYLVGAGPGDPDLLTVKALRLIQSAEIILHDDLVAPEILALAAAEATLVPVGKRCGLKHITQEEIHALMIEFAHAKKIVVRLKGGDPMLFGRAAEEMEALRQAHVPYEIVPGITTAFAAAATTECSLTSRTTASSVLLTTGHLAAQHQGENSQPTRVIYMPGNDWPRLSLKLQEEGLAPSLPCKIVSHVSRADQKIIDTTIERLGLLATVEAPSLLLIGEAMSEPSSRQNESVLDNHAECMV